MNSKLYATAAYDEEQFQGFQATNSDTLSHPPLEACVPLPPPPLSSSELGADPSQSQNGLSEPPVALPDPDKIETVVREASQLQDQFVRLLTHTKIEFLRRPAEFLGELRVTLTTLPLSGRFRHLYFLRTRKGHIMNASNVDEIIWILDDYWDHTEYALLQCLVQEFGDSALQEEMSGYVAALEHFEKKTTIQEYNIAASNCKYPLRHMYYGYNLSRVTVHLSKDPAVCTLYEFRQLKDSLMMRSSLEPYTVCTGTF